MPMESLLEDDYVFVYREKPEEKAENETADDFEHCDTESIKKSIQEQEQKKAPFSNPTGAYSPTEFNKINFRVFREKFSYQESHLNPNMYTLVYHVFKNEMQKRILLFDVIAEYKTQKDRELPSLDEALSYLKKSGISTPDDIVIMPITEPFRGFQRNGHFRLITITKDGVIYYDTKSLGYSLAMRWIFTPLKSAYEMTLEDVATKIAGTVGFTQKLMLMASSAMNFPSTCVNYFDNVARTCREHYPEKLFSERTLAYQAWYNSTECGPSTITAGVSVASGVEPPPPSEATNNIRASLEANHTPPSIAVRTNITGSCLTC